jgi:hypothetical protein
MLLWLTVLLLGEGAGGSAVSTAPVNPTVTIRPSVRCTPSIRPSLSVTPTISP